MQCSRVHMNVDRVSFLIIPAVQTGKINKSVQKSSKISAKVNMRLVQSEVDKSNAYMQLLESVSLLKAWTEFHIKTTVTHFIGK